MTAFKSGRGIWELVGIALVIPMILMFGGTAVGQTVSDVTVTSSSSFNLETDSLICTYTLGGGAGIAATAWYLDGNPYLALYLPIEGGTGNASNDLSGNGVAITAPDGDPTFTVNGGYDGVSSAALFGANANYSAGETFPAGSSYTKMMWVYRTGDGIGGGGNLMSGDAGHVFWAPDNEDKKLSAGHSSPWRQVQDTDSLNLNTWYHVAVTWDNVSGEMVLYKNGSVVDQATVTTSVTDQTLFVGAFAGGYEWEGYLDDVRLYARALTPEQINAYYNGGAGDPDIIVQEEVEPGQTWRADVTPFLTNVQGVTVASNDVVIGSGPDPTVDDLVLESTSGSFLTTDALSVSYTLDSGATSVATAWYRDGSPLMTVYIPGSGGSTAAILDYSGNAQAITPAGSAPVFVANGGHDGVRGALTFDAGQSLSAGEIMPLSSSYTKACWIYRTGAGVSNGGNLISGDTGPGHVFWAPNIHGWYLSAGHSSPWDQAQDTSGIIELNTWYHVAVTYDASSELMTLYKDGVEVDTVTQPMNATDATLNVGRYGTGYEWQGLMEDIRVYPEALSPEQIASLSSAGGEEIVPEETEIGEMWSATVTPFSVTAAGSSVSTLTETMTSVADITGNVSAGGTGMYGVSVMLFDGLGAMLDATVTDENGYYEFLDNPWGDYVVTIATPLGYTADAEEKWVALVGADATVDFALTPIAIEMTQRGRGYWMHQVNALLREKGQVHESMDDMCAYIEAIRSHFNEHALNPVIVFLVPDFGDDCTVGLEALRDVISPKKQASMADKARAHLTALLLNMVSGKIAQWHEISEDGLTVSQAVTYCNALIADADVDNDEMAKDIAEMINEGMMVPAGWIDPTTPVIAYRVGQDVLPSSPQLTQNYPNPFNPSTVIEFALPEAGQVRLEIFNLLGQRVATLIDGQVSAGHHAVSWDAGAKASGVYFYRLETLTFSETKKMVLMK